LVASPGRLLRKVPPAKVLVIGAGVAGPAAIGTVLGAVVRALIRVPWSRSRYRAGAEFLELSFAEDGTGQRLRQGDE